VYLQLISFCSFGFDYSSFFYLRLTHRAGFNRQPATLG